MRKYWDSNPKGFIINVKNDGHTLRYVTSVDNRCVVKILQDEDVL